MKAGNMRKVFVLFIVIALIASLRLPENGSAHTGAALGMINTIAGKGTYSYNGDGIAATSASIAPSGVTVDHEGNIYIADKTNHRIRKVDAATGEISTVAGRGLTSGYREDGLLATEAGLNSPTGIAVDKYGNLYIADTMTVRVRKVDIETGKIFTLAGDRTLGFTGDGEQGTTAKLNLPEGVAVDDDGNIFIADTGNHRIRKIDAVTGIITTVAGNGNEGLDGDGGLATLAQLNHPVAVAVDNQGNLYITDSRNYRIRKVDAVTQIISTIAGNDNSGVLGDGGPATLAQIDPYGITVDSAGNLYIADQKNQRIRKVDAVTGIITTVAGSTNIGGYGGDGGLATSAQLNIPKGVAVDSSGTLYFTDSINARVRSVLMPFTVTYYGNNNTRGTVPVSISQQFNSTAVVADNPGNLERWGYTFAGWNSAPDGSGIPYAAGETVVLSSDIRLYAQWTFDGFTAAGGIITTLAGDGTAEFDGDGGPAQSSQLNYPADVTVDSAGNVYIVDTMNERIRKVDAATGVISTVPGYGYDIRPGGSLPVRCSPQQAALDNAGNLYVAESGCHRVVKIDTAGNVTAVAGNGTQGYSGDGESATEAQLNQPYGVAVDDGGNVYIADTFNDLIRMVDVNTGMISTIAGTMAESSGLDGRQATDTSLSRPYGIEIDNSGNFYIVESTNSRIRKVDASGIVSTVVGGRIDGPDGDGGPVTEARLRHPRKVTLDSTGNLYIADSSNQRIRKVDADTNIIRTVAGDGTEMTGAYGGDGGEATLAQLNSPSGVAVGPKGEIYIADKNNHRIRVVSITYTALFDGNGYMWGTVSAPEIRDVDHLEVTIPGNMGGIGKKGFTFTGWNAMPDGSGTDYAPGTNVTLIGNLTLYAQWTPVAMHHIYYDGNGHTGGSEPGYDEVFGPGEPVEVLGNTNHLVRKGYQFAGWNTAADGTGTSYTAGDTLIMGTTGMTLYAIWIENKGSQFVLNITAENGDIVGAQAEYFLGERAVITALPNEGYQFDSWADAATGRVVGVQETYSFYITGNVSLTANFRPVLPDVFTVIFMSESGQIWSVQQIARDGHAAAPVSPTKPDHDFIGWSADYTHVQSNLIVRPIYSAKGTTYSLTVVGGSIPSGITDYVFDSKVTVTADVAPEGEQFSHWMADGELVSYDPVYSFHISGDVTVIAVFSASPEDRKPLALISSNAIADASAGKIHFIAQAAVPSGFVLLESGVVAIQSAVAPDNLDFNSTGAIRAAARSLTDTGQFMMNKSGVLSGETWHARAYLIYRDPAGEVKIVYSKNTVSRTMP